MSKKRIYIAGLMLRKKAISQPQPQQKGQNNDNNN